MTSKKRLIWLYRPIETLENAEGGTRTPTPLRAQRPERCVSTSFTTSADVIVLSSLMVDWHYITVSLATCQEDSRTILELCGFSFFFLG